MVEKAKTILRKLLLVDKKGTVKPVYIDHPIFVAIGNRWRLFRGNFWKRDPKIVVYFGSWGSTVFILTTAKSSCRSKIRLKISVWRGHWEGFKALTRLRFNEEKRGRLSKTEQISFPKTILISILNFRQKMYFVVEITQLHLDTLPFFFIPF